jgi:hypothetical protein
MNRREGGVAIGTKFLRWGLDPLVFGIFIGFGDDQRALHLKLHI